MTMASPDVQRAGTHFLHGDDAIAEGALAAGCRFFAGYPITPSTEVAERMARRLPEVDGIYIQMEDELASIAAILGAAWTGQRTMTATSGPGFSLMTENLGLGLITETPTVIVNVQRGGPSTGLPTMVGQGDMMQARFGSHGDYALIALTPWGAQECFDMTVRAFNLADRFRVPVIILTDSEVGHLTEKVVIPPWETLERTERKRPGTPPHPDFKPFEPGKKDLIPPMLHAGEGYHVVVDSLTHDERGYPVMTAEAHVKLVTRLIDKIRKFSDEIIDYEERQMEDAEIVVLSYGISARVALAAIEEARENGIKVGLLRLKTVWPFPEEHVRELSKHIKGFVVPEINMGQIALEVKRCSVDRCQVRLVPHPGGDVHDPAVVLQAIREVAEGRVPARSRPTSDGRVPPAIHPIPGAAEV
jgi:2-oxoglutarate/2-oxoacid ferredoxin oxidoreductase subunit alpha